jgi:predicted nucleic acid-binding protein
MSVFIDTSALFAVFDRDDEHHAAAAERWRELVDADEALFCSNYVLVETYALVQRRLGIEAVRVLDRDVTPLVEILWIDHDVHRIAVGALLAAGRRDLSLVDCASFEVMRRANLVRAFAFDPHFSEQGFEMVS